jgi:hypothetical protein
MGPLRNIDWTLFTLAVILDQQSVCTRGSGAEDFRTANDSARAY